MTRDIIAQKERHDKGHYSRERTRRQATLQQRKNDMTRDTTAEKERHDKGHCSRERTRNDMRHYSRERTR